MKKNAFTLIEILVATFIFAFLIMGLYFIFDKSHSGWEKGNARLEQYQKAREFLNILNREIKSVFISSSNKNIVFRGNEHEILFMCSTNVPNRKGEYDLKEVEYRLSGNQLKRRVKSVFDKKSNLGRISILASNIAELKFSYHNGKNWQKTWDSKKDRSKKDFILPQAIRVEIVVKGESVMPLTFSTVISIPVSH